MTEIQSETRKDEAEARLDPREDWQRAHSELLRLAGRQSTLDAEIGTWMLRARRAATHLRLGYATFAEYAERLFGFAPRLIADKLRVAEALEELPELAGALTTGALSWSGIRELVRVATPSTETEWLRAARSKTVRQIERLVSGLAPGARPGDPPDDRLRRHVLRFEVMGETLATFREMMTRIRREAAGPLDDDAALLEVARRILGGPADDGRASYQVMVTRCEDCGRARQQGGADLVDIDAVTTEVMACDAQLVAFTSASDVNASAERTRGAAETADAHVGAPTPAHVAARATQTIPPVIRRAVLRRDGHRCVVPGCRNHVFVDVHHIRPRSEGGAHDPDGLVTLCAGHHRAVHRGAIRIGGTPRTGVTAQHADGTPYGGPVQPATSDVAVKLFGALRGLGFRETETRRALAELAAHMSVGEPIESLLRRALLLLTEKRAAAA